jgi:hypothetical protein
MRDQSVKLLIDKLRIVACRVFKISGHPGYFKIEGGAIKTRLISDSGCTLWHESGNYFKDFFNNELEICDDIDYETGQPKPKPVDFATALRDMIDNPQALYKCCERIFYYRYVDLYEFNKSQSPESCGRIATDSIGYYLNKNWFKIK